MVGSVLSDLSDLSALSDLWRGMRGRCTLMYLVAYDIPDNRRRGRLAEALLAFGVRVQESVFECDLRAKNELARMLDHIRREIMPEDGDHVRIYRLCADCLAQTIILGEGQIATDPDLIII